MTTVTLIAPLTETEARALVTDIRTDIAEIGRIEQLASAKLLRLYETEGWRVLGYDNFRTMAEAEFGKSWQHLYRILGAERLRNELLLIAPDDTPIVIPEIHARELNTLPDAKTRLEAYQRAKDLAMSEGETAVKLRHTKEAVKTVQAATSANKYSVIWQMERRGGISADTAAAMTAAVDQLKPRQRGQMLELIARHGLTCADLIDPIGNMLYWEEKGKTSYVLETLLATGCLGNVPLKIATMTDLKNANAEAQAQHIAEGIEAKRQADFEAGKTPVEEVVVTLFRGDPVRTLKVLEDVLGAGDMARLRDLMMGA